MKSIKDIKKNIGFIEFYSSNNEPITTVTFTKIKYLNKGFRIISKKNQNIDNLFKKFNFNYENNFLLKNRNIVYMIYTFNRNKNLEEKIGEHKGVLTNLVVIDDYYHFTLTK